MRNYSKEELCLIWLDSFNDLGNIHKRNLFQFVKNADSIKTVLDNSRDYIIQNCGENSFNTLINSADNGYLKFVLNNLEKSDIKIVTLLSEWYPKLLRETPCPPLILYALGDVSLLNSECFGVVGSRKSLPFSLKLTENFVTEISKNFTMVTGIAEGVDTKVIETAFKNKAKVISVSAGGFNYLYPKTNANLFDEVKKRGLAITEYPPDVKSKPYYFPVRNRIIAGLSKGVLIVSGGNKSGTVYTAGYARDYDRDVFAVPYNVGVASGAGCNDLIKAGAILADSPNDVLNFYGIKSQSEKFEFTAEEKELIHILSDGEKHVDKICEFLKKEVYEIMPMLSSLEIKGMVINNGLNVYSLTKSFSEE